MNRNGFSVIEVMVAASILAVLSLGMFSLTGAVLKSKSSLSVYLQLFDLRRKVMDSLQRDASWMATIQSNAQAPYFQDTHFDVFVNLNQSPPGVGPYPIYFLHDAQPGTPWYSPMNESEGFKINGDSCDSFPSTACPLRYDLTWTAVCPGGLAPPACPNPMAKIQGIFRAPVPLVDEMQINSSRFDFSLTAGTSYLDSVQKCLQLGGEFLNFKCHFEKQYCITDPNRPFFRGWNADGTPRCAQKCLDPNKPILNGWDSNDNPICRSVIQVGNANQSDGPMTCGKDQVVRGIAEDGTLKCGYPLKETYNGIGIGTMKCGSHERQVGTNLDGSPQCQPLIANALAGSSGVWQCGPGRKPSGIYTDGSLRCVDQNDVTGGTYTCPPGTVYESTNSNGTVNCKVDPNANFQCQNGAKIWGFDGSGNPICRHTECYDGDKLLSIDGPSGNPICERALFSNYQWTETPPKNSETHYSHFQCPTFSIGNTWPAIVPTKILDFTSDVRMTAPSECAGILGARPFAPTVKCDLPGGAVGYGLFGMTIYPWGDDLPDGQDPDSVHPAVYNDNLLSGPEITIGLEVRCVGAYQRLYP